MFKIALELAQENPVYQGVATKFFEHFLRIAHAMTAEGGHGRSLWDEEDGFFYDALHLPDGTLTSLKVRSMVGLLPLFAVDTLEPDLLEQVPDFKRRMEWFYNNRPSLSGNLACIHTPGIGRRRLLSILTRDRLVRVLEKMLDEEEFLSDYGIRSVSKYHKDHPYTFTWTGKRIPSATSRPSPKVTLRGQLKLERAHLVSHELPDHRVPAKVPSLLW